MSWQVDGEVDGGCYAGDGEEEGEDGGGGGGEDPDVGVQLGGPHDHGAPHRPPGVQGEVWAQEVLAIKVERIFPLKRTEHGNNIALKYLRFAQTDENWFEFVDKTEQIQDISGPALDIPSQDRKGRSIRIA